MRFYKIKKPVLYQYTIDGTPLESQMTIRDLGILFDVGVTFVPHIAEIVGKALKTLGYILRIGKDFREVDTFVLLFTSLVRPILEYNSVLWSPYYDVHVRNIERVQNKLLRFINYRLGIPINEINYPEIRNMCGLQTLSERRSISDMVFLYKLINGLIDSPQILQMVNLHIPKRTTRNRCTFSTDLATTNYTFNVPIQRMLREGNRLGDIDIFATSLNYFKKLLIAKYRLTELPV
jgi:hypothetical protein